MEDIIHSVLVPLGHLRVGKIVNEPDKRVCVHLKASDTYGRPGTYVSGEEAAAEICQDLFAITFESPEQADNVASVFHEAAEALRAMHGETSSTAKEKAAPAPVEAFTAVSRGFEVGTIVRHFKGRFYRIEGFPEHTETGERFVCYRQLYPPYKVYVRPEAMFCSEVDYEKYPNVRDVWRMTEVTFDLKGQPHWNVCPGVEATIKLEDV